MISNGYSWMKSFGVFFIYSGMFGVQNGMVIFIVVGVVDYFFGIDLYVSII